MITLIFEPPDMCHVLNKVLGQKGDQDSYRLETVYIELLPHCPARGRCSINIWTRKVRDAQRISKEIFWIIEKHAFSWGSEYTHYIPNSAP